MVCIKRNYCIKYYSQSCLEENTNVLRGTHNHPLLKLHTFISHLIYSWDYVTHPRE